MFIFVFLMVFMAGFRQVIIQKAHEQEWLATLFFGIGLVYSALTLVSDSITGGVGLDAIGGSPDPTAIRALTESTILMFGSVGLILIAAMLFLAGYLTFSTGALPKWTGWVAFLAAILNFAFIPSMYFGNNPQGFYTASGWGPRWGQPSRSWYGLRLRVLRCSESASPSPKCKLQDRINTSVSKELKCQRKPK